MAAAANRFRSNMFTCSFVVAARAFRVMGKASQYQAKPELPNLGLGRREKPAPYAPGAARPSCFPFLTPSACESWCKHEIMVGPRLGKAPSTGLIVSENCVGKLYGSAVNVSRPPEAWLNFQGVVSEQGASRKTFWSPSSCYDLRSWGMCRSRPPHYHGGSGRHDARRYGIRSKFGAVQRLVRRGHLVSGTCRHVFSHRRQARTLRNRPFRD